MGAMMPCQVDNCSISMSCRGVDTSPLFPFGGGGCRCAAVRAFAGCRWCQAISVPGPQISPPTNDCSTFARHCDRDALISLVLVCRAY